MGRATIRTWAPSTCTPASTRSVPIGGEGRTEATSNLGFGGAWAKTKPAQKVVRRIVFMLFTYEAKVKKVPGECGGLAGLTRGFDHRAHRAFGNRHPRIGAALAEESFRIL